MDTNITDAYVPRPLPPDDGSTASAGLAAAATVAAAMLALLVLAVAGWFFAGVYFLREGHAVRTLDVEREIHSKQLADVEAERKVHRKQLARLEEEGDKRLHVAERDLLRARSELRHVQMERETAVQTLKSREKELRALADKLDRRDKAPGFAVD